MKAAKWREFSEEELQQKARELTEESGLNEIACLDAAEMVLVAVVGTGGLRPALEAIEAGKDLARTHTVLRERKGESRG